MKSLTILKPSSFIRTLFVAIFSVLVTMASFAQDEKKVDVNINTGKDSFWGSPWMWVVGAAVFILLLVALLRGGGSKKSA